MRNRSAAFTLVEVLAALAILATAFYLLLELRQKALQNADFASTRLLAVQVARAKMEEVLARGFPDPTVETDRIAEMDVTVNVMDIGDETTRGPMRMIQVEVRYQIGFGESNKLVLSCIDTPMRIEQLPDLEEEFYYEEENP